MSDILKDLLSESGSLITLSDGRIGRNGCSVIEVNECLDYCIESDQDAAACETTCSACIELVVIENEITPSDITDFNKLYEIKQDIYNKQYLEMKDTLYFQEETDNRYLAIVKDGTSVVPVDQDTLALEDISVEPFADAQRYNFE